MQVTIHGNASGPVRNDFTNTKADSPEVQLRRACARVAELERQHAKAQSTFKSAVEDEDTNRDLQALKIDVHRLARELEQASEEVRALENFETQRKLTRLSNLIEETRAKREEFIQQFRATCAALGEYCGNVSEILELVNLEMRLNALNYSPRRNEVLELAKPPRPLEGFSHDPVTHIGYDWRIVVAPINPNGKGA